MIWEWNYVPNWGQSVDSMLDFQQISIHMKKTFLDVLQFGFKLRNHCSSLWCKVSNFAQFCNAVSHPTIHVRIPSDIKGKSHETSSWSCWSKNSVLTILTASFCEEGNELVLKILEIVRACVLEWQPLLAVSRENSSKLLCFTESECLRIMRVDFDEAAIADGWEDSISSETTL